MAAVSELVSALDAELVRLGYKPSTMVWYRGCWRRLERWFASRGVEEFSLDVAMAWVDEACGGFFEKEQAGTLRATDVYLFRVAAMLDDFAAHGAVLRRYSRSVGKLSAEQADVLARFRAWLGAEGCAVSTVRAYGTGALLPVLQTYLGHSWFASELAIEVGSFFNLIRSSPCSQLV